MIKKKKKKDFLDRVQWANRDFYSMWPLVALSRFNTLGGGSALANKVDAGILPSSSQPGGRDP